MSALTFTDLAEVSSKNRDGGSYIVRVSGASSDALVYSGVLNEDNDGAPRCYGRFPGDLGLDHLANATSQVGGAHFTALPKGVFAHDWRWVGLVALTRAEATAQGVLGRLDDRPELAGRNRKGAAVNDPAIPPRFPVKRADDPNFYVSTTALARNSGAAAADPARYWDASTVNYAAITPPLIDAGVQLGDFGLAVRRDTGAASAFLFADAGSGQKIGEVSRHLFRALFPRADQEEHFVAFLVLPGSRTSPIANTPDAALRRFLVSASNQSNADTLIDLMGSATSFRALGTERTEMYVIDDVRRFRRHRAEDLDTGVSYARSQTIRQALQAFGYDPVAAERARAAATPPLKISIPPPPADLLRLKIPGA